MCSVKVSILSIRKQKQKNPSNEKKTYILISSIKLAVLCLSIKDRHNLPHLPMLSFQYWNCFCKAALSSILRGTIGLYFRKPSGRSQKVSDGRSLQCFIKVHWSALNIRDELLKCSLTGQGNILSPKDTINSGQVSSCWQRGGSQTSALSL